jgi:hypothetical protein
MLHMRRQNDHAFSTKLTQVQNIKMVGKEVMVGVGVEEPWAYLRNCSSLQQVDGYNIVVVVVVAGNYFLGDRMVEAFDIVAAVVGMLVVVVVVAVVAFHTMAWHFPQIVAHILAVVD